LCDRLSFHCIYVSNSEDDTITVINPKTRKGIKTIKTGDKSWELTVGPNGKFVYVVNRHDHTLQVLIEKRIK
jgi:YVTN family beta-propeller protein